jgi:putative sigma-54 modulation protein
MRIEFTGRHREVPDQIRALTERKLRKLARVLPRITDVHVILAADRHRQSAEVTVHSSHLTLAAADESGDMAGAISTVIEKLTRQAQRHVGKLRERKRQPTSRETALWAGVLKGGVAGEAPRVIRSQRFVVKPMTVEEAALEVDGREEGFLVFRDAATERVNVLYRRKDGNLGLIEPEA